MRGRSYSNSYSPSPPRSYGRKRYRSPSPRVRYGGCSRDLPTSLLVRNLRHDCRVEDLRGPFGQFGRLKDIYLPRDYYTGEPRGFGFVTQNIIWMKPSEMRQREHRRSQSYRRSPLRYSRSPRYDRSYSCSPDYYSPPRRRQSISPTERRYGGRSYSRSPYSRSRSRSPSVASSRSVDYSR
ncbi:hypothetical protein HRI_000783600 [Hibiscus trionum]|uniref:RRM domain-containing protein n=1 Tax=Hibiscus trionum TaxID=183268 RepID=A0A9W7H5N2_HIBTR|nr:hypothetical protein HRI_000783600 [Hibiscus trionum]